MLRLTARDAWNVNQRRDISSWLARWFPKTPAKSVVALKAPIKVELVAGKTYRWCVCGRSKKQEACGPRIPRPWTPTLGRFCPDSATPSFSHVSPQSSPRNPSPLSASDFLLHLPWEPFIPPGTLPISFVPWPLSFLSIALNWAPPSPVAQCQQPRTPVPLCLSNLLQTLSRSL